MPRWLQWVWLTCLSLALCAGLGVVVHDHRRAVAVVPAAPPAPHLLGSTPGGTSAFYDNERLNLRQFWVSDPVYGAKCDGATDDTTAIGNAESDRSLVGGTLRIPPSICMVSALLSPGAGAVWAGTPGQSTIRASTAIVAPVAFTGPSSVSGIVFDGNRLATDVLLRVSDSRSSYVDVQANNGVRDGVRAAMSTGANSISAVTKTGTGPSITVAATDLFFLQPPGPHTWLKIFTGGALGTATFQDSVDNVTYSGVPQTLFASTNIGFTTGTAFVTDTGLQVTAPAGTYVSGTTYDFTVSVGQSHNNNSSLQRVTANGDGTVYVTSGFTADYTGPTFNPIAATGTIATTAGSQILFGTSTHFLSMHITDGDGIRLDTAGPVHHRFMISTVLSDTVLALDVQSPPQFTASGLDFAIASGAGIHEDPETGQQLGTVCDHCETTSSATGVKAIGLGGVYLIAPVCHNPVTTCWQFGTAFPD